VRFRTSGQVWELSLSHEEAWVMVLADHDGTNIHAGCWCVAWKTGYSWRHTKRLTDRLIEKGTVIEVKDNSGQAVRWDLGFTSVARKQHNL
jgi:hypothetical protein